jgi:hypothetical protein
MDLTAVVSHVGGCVTAEWRKSADVFFGGR